MLLFSNFHATIILSEYFCTHLATSCIGSLHRSCFQPTNGRLPNLEVLKTKDMPRAEVPIGDEYKAILILYRMLCIA